MIEDSFKRIDDYCNAHEKSIPIRNNAYCYFALAYQKAIAEYEAHRASAAGAVAQTTILETLLTTENIEGYVAKSEKMLDDAERKLLRMVQKESTRFSFWSSVLASVTGSFFYSLLLLLIYWIIVQDISSPFDFAEPTKRLEPRGTDEPSTLEVKRENPQSTESRPEERSH
tara:strand:- start:145 stop:657 length:513 start_codon:yes stop_codon:yes gene_type:complete